MDVKTLRGKAKAAIWEMEKRTGETPMMVQGRLTLTSGTPITTADVPDTNAIYFTPYQGNRIALYDDVLGYWKFYEFTQRTLDLSLLTLTSGFNYDVFAYDAAGVVTLEATIWASDTARVGANDLTDQDGVLVNSGSLDRRYLGTFRATGVNTTRDTLSNRFLWNYYHRQPRVLSVTEPVDSYVYNSATRRQLNGNAANQVDYVIGWEEQPVFSSANMVVLGQTTNLVNSICTCTAADSTSVCTADGFRGGDTRNMIRNPLWTESNHYHAMGYHFISWMDASFNDTGANDPIWYGDDNLDGRIQTGMFVIIDG